MELWATNFCLQTTMSSSLLERSYKINTTGMLPLHHAFSLMWAEDRKRRPHLTLIADRWGVDLTWRRTWACSKEQERRLRMRGHHGLGFWFSPLHACALCSGQDAPPSRPPCRPLQNEFSMILSTAPAGTLCPLVLQHFQSFKNQQKLRREHSVKWWP